MHLLIDLARPFTDPVMIFAVAMVVILVVPLLFQRIRIPGMVGLILAGIVIGPNAANILDRDPTIVLLGTVGLLYIMFLAGLEINLNLFNKHRNRSVVFGALTFILPQGIGTLAALYVLNFSLPAAILLGSLFASHTLLAYPIASRLGLSKTIYSTTAVGATIITDTAALLVLAVVAASTRGALDALFWFQLVIFLAVFVLIIFWGVPKLGRWFFRHVRTGGAAEFAFVLATVFVAAVLAEVAGVEAIIGAFLAGLSLNRLVPEHGPLMNRIAFVGESLFIPFFLLSVGMLVDLRVLVAGLDAWIIAGTMLGCVLIAKWGAAQLLRPLYGHSAAEAGFVFGLTIPQAAATLAAALIGFEVGLFDTSILNGTILMILITCIIGPYATEIYGRKLVLRAEAGATQTADIPERILVPLANPATAETLMDLAFYVRQTISDEPVFPLTVVPDGDSARVASAEKLVSHAVVHAAAADMPVVPMTRVDNDVVTGVHRAIRERRITTVIIGWQGDVSVGQRIFGSILDRLLEEVRQMVMVCRVDHPLNTTRRVVLLVPPMAEFEIGFDDAARAVKRIAGQIGAGLEIVVEEQALDRLGPRMKRLKPDVEITFTGLPAWRTVIEHLESRIEEDDFLLMLSAREGSLAWRPALNRLPRVLSQRFSNVNFVAIYPSEEFAQSDGLPVNTGIVFSGEGTVTGVALQIEAKTIEEAARAVLESRFEDAPARENTLHQLMSTSDTLSPEIRPGVILLHARIDAVKSPEVLIGTSDDGLSLERASQPVHVVVLVLSPTGTAQGEHVRTLAWVARHLRTEEALSTMRSATSAEELRLAFNLSEPGPVINSP